MKKIILVVLLMCMTLTSFAQKWEKYYQEADELRGTQASSRHYIEIPKEGIVALEDNRHDRGTLILRSDRIYP